MLPLLIAFIALAFAIRRLLQPSSDNNWKHSSNNQSNQQNDKSVAHKKLLEEAFEHAPFSLDDDDNIVEHEDLSQLSPDERPNPIVILYASEYGFALTVAKSIAEYLHTTQNDIKMYPRIVNVLHYNVIDFTKETFIILVCSTTGDGVPPNEAASFHQALNNSQIQFSSNSFFSVLALGDRAYPHFCRAGTIFNDIFKKQIQNEIIQKVDIDQEDWDTINEFTTNLNDKIISIIQNNINYEAPENNDYLPATIQKYAKTLALGSTQYTRNNPYLSKLIYKKQLTKNIQQKDHKQVARIELDISNGGIDYEVGDAIGILPQNNSIYVNKILRSLASNGDEIIQVGEEIKSISNLKEMTLDKALNEYYDLKIIKPNFILLLSRFSNDIREIELAKQILGVDPRYNISKNPSFTDYGKQYIQQREVFDILNDFPSTSISSQQLIDHLKPLHARYYSISSSNIINADKIAITVDIIRYNTLGIDRQGVASTFLMDRCIENETQIPIFISHNANFKLPEDKSKPIIMIGPGTGIAPFIGFIEQRIHTNSTGKNILFFGCRYSKQDFLYEEELKSFEKNNHLQLYTAFSRDNQQKDYVQHRMKEIQQDLWSLIHNEQAHIYVCGDGGKMAEDVDKQWRHIIKEFGELDDQGVEDYMSNLTNAKRYQRDVWVS